MPASSPTLKGAELGQKLTASRYAAAIPRLRADLLQAHFQLRQAKFPVILIVSGADGAGKGELVHRLNEWLDPRGVSTHACWDTSDEERERPRYWRFWRSLPANGRIGILFGSWYTEPIIRRVEHECKRTAFASELSQIAAFEHMLATEGALILKFWLHLPKAEQKARLRKLERKGRIAPNDWKHFKLYDRFTKVCDQVLQQTHTPEAPWHVIEATDRRHREFAVGRILLQALTRRLQPAAPARKSAAARPTVAKRRPTSSRLGEVDLAQTLSPKDYRQALQAAQDRLAKLAWAAHEKKVSLILAFEGWDAAGKGSAIRRVTQAMDPRLYHVVGIAAPTEEERAHHYLWRFWRHLPRDGTSLIFDRTWYGRVLVERIEHFATPEQWGRAYDEINDFEAQLAAHGNVVQKFWIHISPEEQLRRFKERETVPYKRYKITEEDWRNREKWPDYLQAVEDMIQRCHTPAAPWTIVAGNDKRFARVQIVQTIVKRLEDVL